MLSSITCIILFQIAWLSKPPSYRIHESHATALSSVVTSSWSNPPVLLNLILVPYILIKLNHIISFMLKVSLPACHIVYINPILVSFATHSDLSKYPYQTMIYHALPNHNMCLEPNTYMTLTTLMHVLSILLNSIQVFVNPNLFHLYLWSFMFIKP